MCGICGLIGDGVGPTGDASTVLRRMSGAKVAMGLGEGRPEVERWFGRAVKADPDDLAAYRMKLLYLEPKWHGDAQGREMLEFEVDAFLRRKGWTSTTATPGCYLAWERTVGGQRLVVGKELALAMQAHLDDEPSDGEEG